MATINIRSLNTHYHHDPNAFLLEEIIGKGSWFGLKSTRITAKLTFFSGSSLKKKQSLP
jgi:hypothetical protein